MLVNVMPFGFTLVGLHISHHSIDFPVYLEFFQLIKGGYFLEFRVQGMSEHSVRIIVTGEQRGCFGIMRSGGGLVDRLFDGVDTRA